MPALNAFENAIWGKKLNKITFVDDATLLVDLCNLSLLTAYFIKDYVNYKTTMLNKITQFNNFQWRWWRWRQPALP